MMDRFVNGEERIRKEEIMEIWDGYLIDGTRANQELVRGEPIPKGLYHLVSEILVRHVDGDYLLMRRDIRKQNYGGCYEATAGGAALKGESKVACAKRELLEETGISSDNFREIGQYISHDTIYHNFLCVTDCDKASVSIREGETMSYKWLPENAFIAFVNSAEMIDVQRARYHDYFVQLGYIR